MIPPFINKDILPHKPGVYIYRNDSGEIIYVGKAVDLYHRVSSYFSGVPDNPKTAALVDNIASCETIVVASELEALILEANLIKKHLPQYNIKLTDDKDYLYIKITDEAFPKILTARKKELSDAKDYFGPFPSSTSVRSTLKKMRRIFPWCSNPPPDNVDFRKWRPCFYYHLNLCPGPCANKISSYEYGKLIKRFIQFMQGQKDEVIKALVEEMEGYVENLEFEKAQQTKKVIQGIEYLTQPNTSAQVYLENPNFIEDQNQQGLVELQRSLGLEEFPERIECYDISNIQGQLAVGSLVVLTGGDIDKKWYRKFKIRVDGKPNDVAMMREVIKRRLKHSEWPMPNILLVDGGKGQVRAATEEVVMKGLNISVFGLAKRLEWIYTTEKDVIKLKKSSLALRLLQKIRDEAHRFAVTYHRNLRHRSVFASQDTGSSPPGKYSAKIDDR